jgi:hypothetical protein
MKTLSLALATFSILLLSVLGAFTPEEKQSMLDRHNTYRSRVARGTEGNPQGADIVLMDWEERATKDANRWASQCKNGHNSMKERRFGSYDLVGQNAATFAEPSANVVKSVDGWFNEIKDYNHTKHLCTSGAICGHYTQVIWSATAVVGCGNAVCPNNMLQTTIICNYAPGGNFDGEQPYKTGPPCSSCPSNFPRCMNGLCATDSQCQKAGFPCTNSTVTDQALTRETNFNPDNIIARC